MGKSVIKTIAAALAFVLLPSLALAAGLGKLTVLSGLGQPLKAEIELVAMQKGEAGSLGVRLPPIEAFRQANIDYSGALLSIKFSIEQRGEDRYVIALSSTQPMNEPFLDLLVELDWATGRLVREYTFLLDPPEYKPPQQAAEVAAPTVPAVPVIKPVEAPKQPESRASDRPAATPSGTAGPAGAAAPAAPPKAARSYEVKRGDTLAKIANTNKSDAVSLQQMLIALYRSNADAFDGNNMNRLRAGKILNIPDPAAAAAVDQSDAKRVVVAQAAEFNDYRRKLGAAVAAAPERAEARRQSASGKITAKVEDAPAAAKETKDQLKLSKAEELGKPGAKRGSPGLQEDLVAKEKALKEASERIAMLEKNVQDMKKLLELKSQAGAQLQQQAAKAGAAKAAEPAKAQEAVKPAAPAKAPEPAKAAEPAKALASAKAPEPAKALAPAKAPEPAKAAEPVKVPEPAKAAAAKAAPKAAPPPPPEPSLIEEILGNELALYGGGGFLLLLFGGYGYYAWKRKKSLQQIESSVMGAPSLAVDPVFGAAGGAKVDTGASEIQGDFSQDAAAVAIDSEEVDPIAEADVYMAYGRDAQAEEILKEALAKDSTRQPIRAKLLEIYAGRKDVKAFESVAAELHAGTGGEGELWQKAAALGLQIDPGNPLYGGTVPADGSSAHDDTQVLADGGIVAAAAPAPEIVPDAAEKPAESPGLDFDLGLSEPGVAAPGGTPEDAPAPATELTSDLGFDLDLGGGEATPAAAPAASGIDIDIAAGGTVILDTRVPAPAPAPADAGASIDFDFELPGAGDTAKAEPAPAAAETPAAAAPADGGGGIDFDFNLDLPAAKEDAPAEAPAAPLDLSSFSLDLGAPGEAAAPADAHWQEVATKLDLAKAYQEMGDKDGARELLNEVLKEGDAAQQQQAQTMLTALG